MLPLIAAGLVGVAIGKIFSEETKPQEVRVVEEHVQNTNNYTYTQNNYTYNVNVKNNNNKKKKSYHLTYHKHNHTKQKNKKYFLPNRANVQQIPYNNNRLQLSKEALDNRANQLNPNNNLYQGTKKKKR